MPTSSREPVPGKNGGGADENEALDEVGLRLAVWLVCHVSGAFAVRIHVTPGDRVRRGGVVKIILAGGQVTLVPAPGSLSLPCDWHECPPAMRASEKSGGGGSCPL